jgi:hypothetical protein
MRSGMNTMLPPGQRVLDHFPRFGVPAYANRLPEMPAGFELQVQAKDGPRPHFESKTSTSWSEKKSSLIFTV